jgi:hypothetical protein
LLCIIFDAKVLIPWLLQSTLSNNPSGSKSFATGQLISQPNFSYRKTRVSSYCQPRISSYCQTFCCGNAGYGQFDLVWTGSRGQSISETPPTSDLSGSNPQLLLSFVAPMDARYATVYMYTTACSTAYVRIPASTMLPVFFFVSLMYSA